VTTIDPAIWGPEAARGRLCVDTSGLFAYFYPADEHHDDARAFFAWLKRKETAPWRMFVNDYVIDELCSLLARKSGPETAIRVLHHVRDSDALPIVRVPAETFEHSMESFAQYDDKTIPFTDHVVSAHAFDRDASVYSFDARDFGILGNDVIPRRSDAR